MERHKFLFSQQRTLHGLNLDQKVQLKLIKLIQAMQASLLRVHMEYMAKMLHAGPHQGYLNNIDSRSGILRRLTGFQVYYIKTTQGLIRDRSKLEI